MKRIAPKFGIHLPALSTLCAILVAGFAHTAATAQSTPAPKPAPDGDKPWISVVGMWDFETEPYHDGTCRLSGRMSIFTTDTPGTMACQFRAVEECKGFANAFVVHSEQSCTTRSINSALIIDSEIISVDDGFEYSYYPDNFTLRMSTIDEMRGLLRSVGTHPVVFRRVMELTS